MKNRSRGNKTPECEIARRIAKVSELLLAGVSRAQIVHFSAKEWATGTGTADRYIAEAVRQFRENFSHDLKAESQKALSRYENIFARCMAVQNFKEAASVQDRICKLLGLYQPEKVEHTGQPAIVVKIGDAIVPQGQPTKNG
jgi:hypothetical protein